VLVVSAQVVCKLIQDSCSGTYLRSKPWRCLEKPVNRDYNNEGAAALMSLIEGLIAVWLVFEKSIAIMT